MRGDFGDFGAPGVRVDLPGAGPARDAIARAARDEGVDVEVIHLRRLDHGALVPLTFLVEAGWSGPTVVVGLPSSSTHPSPDELVAFGRAVARATGDRRWVVVASGDCSHRLIPGAPAGFDPRARELDLALKDIVARGHDEGLFAIDPALRELAAEDVVDTVAIAAAATNHGASGREVLSYEGPFGVGYLVALLHDEDHREQQPAPEERAPTRWSSTWRATRSRPRWPIDPAGASLRPASTTRATRGAS